MSSFSSGLFKHCFCVRILCSVTSVGLKCLVASETKTCLGCSSFLSSSFWGPCSSPCWFSCCRRQLLTLSLIALSAEMNITWRHLQVIDIAVDVTWIRFHASSYQNLKIGKVPTAIFNLSTFCHIHCARLPLFSLELTHIFFSSLKFQCVDPFLSSHLFFFLKQLQFRVVFSFDSYVRWLEYFFRYWSGARKTHKDTDNFLVTVWGTC
jgi:hypothetical protein